MAGKTLLTLNVGKGRVENGHRHLTRRTTRTPSSPRDYRTANPLYCSTTCPGCPDLEGGTIHGTGQWLRVL